MTNKRLEELKDQASKYAYIVAGAGNENTQDVIDWLEDILRILDDALSRAVRHKKAIELIYKVIDSGVNSDRVAKLAMAIDLIREEADE